MRPRARTPGIRVHSVRHPSITDLVSAPESSAAGSAEGADASGENQSRVAAYLHNRWKQRSIRGKSGGDA